MKVNFVLHIHQDSRRALSANFDTLEHSGTPIDEMTFDGRVLKFEIKRAFATFEGLLNESKFPANGPSRPIVSRLHLREA